MSNKSIVIYIVLVLVLAWAIWIYVTREDAMTYLKRVSQERQGATQE